MSVVSPYAGFVPTRINIQGLIQVCISASAPIHMNLLRGAVTKLRAAHVVNVVICRAFPVYLCFF